MSAMVVTQRPNRHWNRFRRQLITSLSNIVPRVQTKHVVRQQLQISWVRQPWHCQTKMEKLEFAKSKGLLNGYLFNRFERVMLYLRLLSDLKSVSYTYEELNSMYPFSRDQKLRGLKNMFSNYLILFSDFELFADKHPVYRPYYLFYSCSALLLNMAMDIKKEMRKAA